VGRAAVAPDPRTSSATVAIVGNPNAGKTTLFNSLTGARQKVANYPGVTVEKISGVLTVGGKSFDVIDVPGLYSMRAVSEDEAVAARVILGEEPGAAKPDLLICVVDATNLERNLYIYAQLAEMGMPTIVVLTMVDRVEWLNQAIDVKKLSELLGTRVIAVDGHRGSGIDALRRAIAEGIESPPVPSPHASSGSELFEGTSPRHRQELAEAAERVQLRYAWTAEVSTAAVKQRPGARRKRITDRIDRVLTHRVFGLAVFAGLMYLVFQSIYTFADPIMKGISAIFDHISNPIAAALVGQPILKSFLCDGLIAGLSAMFQFLPQILILFFFISLLEGTGYLARAAFLMDRLLGWCGLNGRAFIPLLSSFACAIPGIMAARVMPDARSRMATILVAPLMSCSARLPVYIMLIGSFIEPKYGPVWAGIALFGMHLLGLVVAVPIVWVLNRTVIKGKRLPFVLELPPYQWPRWRDVALSMYSRAKVFVTIAGTTIVMTAVVVWTLSYFPRSNGEAEQFRQEYVVHHSGEFGIQNSGSGAVSSAPESTSVATNDNLDHYVAERELETSYLGRIGHGLEPVFRPAGFDWRITTGILAAFPARENIVPALGIIFSLGKDVEGPTPDLRTRLRNETWPDGRPLLNPWSAVGLMVFFALCCQCMSTLATVRRETGTWKWAIFMFCYMTGLAYLGAVGVYQLGRLFGA
jgi:ferrous iron transport protein B